MDSSVYNLDDLDFNWMTPKHVNNMNMNFVYIDELKKRNIDWCYQVTGYKSRNEKIEHFCKYCNKYINISPSTVLNGNYHDGCLITRYDSNDKYNNFLHENNIQLCPLEICYKSSIKYEHLCLKCFDVIKISPNSVVSYFSKGICFCQNCGGKSLRVGKNSLWDTNSDIASMLKDKQDGYRTTKGSDEKFDWICPNCSCVVRQKSVHNTVANGLVCPICSNTKSKGHRLVCALLNHLNIEFFDEQEFDWSNNKRYDIYVPDKKCIIEVNGIQHYEYTLLNKISNKGIEGQREIDNLKKCMALSNGIDNYIEIDARFSDDEYIINNMITNEEFNCVFNLNQVDWSLVMYKANESVLLTTMNLYNSGMSVSQIAKIVSMADVTIQRYLQILNKVGKCIYTGVDEMKKSVVCLNTREIFDSLKSAGEKYGIDGSGISYVCKHQRNRVYAGKDENGNRLMWMFYDEYINKTDDEINELLSSQYSKMKKRSNVKCITTGEVFKTQAEAKFKYPTASSISDCCRGIVGYSGVLNGEKLCWEYI